jgi:hypothetical protein
MDFSLIQGDQPLSYAMEIARMGILICLAPLFGMIFKDLSHGFEEGVKRGKRRKVWFTMMVYIVAIALLLGWLQPFTWIRLGALVLFAPLLGYLAMFGATKIKRPRLRE